MHPWLPCPSWRSKQPTFPAGLRRPDDLENGDADDNLPETVDWITQRLDTLKFSVCLQNLTVYVLPSHQEDISLFSPMVSVPKVEISGCASLLLGKSFFACISVFDLLLVSLTQAFQCSEEEAVPSRTQEDSADVPEQTPPAFSWLPRFVVTTYLGTVKG